jgi:hypothetical protein
MLPSPLSPISLLLFIILTTVGYSACDEYVTMLPFRILHDDFSLILPVRDLLATTGF